MNKTSEENQTGELKASWLGWAWVLPQLLLGALNGHAWMLVRGDMSPFQYTRALSIGIFGMVLLAFGTLALVIQAGRKKPIGISLALAAIAAHTGYLWLFLQSIDRLLPTTVTLWMLPQTELIFYQFSLIMPVIFLMFVRLSRIKLGLSTPVDVGLSLGTIVIIPAGALILGSMLARLAHTFSWYDNFQYLLIAAMVAGTALILIAFLRLLLRLHDLIQRRSWSAWVIPLTAGLAAPLSGLALNATIPFPYDFQDGAVYLMTLLNAAALLIPFRPETRWAFPGWLARAVFYPFTVYFFLVFLPFLPLSLLAMIVAGAGFLILAPLLLFTVHTRGLLEQGRALATQYGTSRIIAAFIACVLMLPALFMLRNEGDRRTLTQAVDTVFSPDYTATRIPLRTSPLLRALDRMDDMKHGIYLPYVSYAYNAMVFNGMVLPDEKANLIRQSLLGVAKAEVARSGFWGNDFFGGRRRGERRNRGAGVSHQVVVAAHEATYHHTNGVTDTEIRFVLENRGGANGEFSERIAVPEGVLVTGFWLDVNGTNKPAQLRERKTATWVYEMIRDMTRRDPGLVVYEDDQHLRLRVYPFAAGEKRSCGLRFRFPPALTPSIQLSDIAIPLTEIAMIPPDEAKPPAEPTTLQGAARAVCTPLENGATALVVPAGVATNWPSFRREVVAHLILDHSAQAKTNQAFIVSQAQAALEILPPSISRVRITWANYEQEDALGEPMSRAAALSAIARGCSLPIRGGFCADRVISRAIIANKAIPQRPEPAGYAPLFVVIPAFGSSPVQSINLTPFAQLVPDLPAYALFGSNGLSCISFHTAIPAPAQPADFAPTAMVALRYGKMTTWIANDKNSLVFAPVSEPAGWQIWNPARSQFEKMEALTICNDTTYLAGLALWSRHRTLAWTPAAVDAALPDLITATRTAGLLIPESAFIVAETQAQEVLLARKESQALGANHALEFDNARTDKAPAPPVVWLILPALWVLWRFRRVRNA